MHMGASGTLSAGIRHPAAASKTLCGVGGRSSRGRHWIFREQLTSAIAKSGAQLVVASRNLGRLQQLSDEETKRGYRVHGETYDQGDDSEGVVVDHPSDLGFMRQAK
jgi:hypothetical protein